MPKFVFAYHGQPEFETPEDGKNHMAEWEDWSSSLGAAVIDPGMPVSKSWTVTPKGVEDNGGSNPLSGISIIEADSIEAAIEMAKPCPHVKRGGTIEVAEAMDMSLHD